MTKDELIQYLRVCADLAAGPEDGIAHVAIVPLRQAIQLLESPAEPKAECTAAFHEEAALLGTTICHFCHKQIRDIGSR